MDGICLSINVFVCLFTLEAILRGLRAFSQSYRVYFRLVLSVLLAALDVHANILSKEDLCQLHIDMRY